MTTEKSFKLLFWASSLCMLLMSMSFLFMPIASEKALDGNDWCLILAGFMFWTPLLTGYILIIVMNKRRKRQIKDNNKVNIKNWGVLKIISNRPAFMADVSFIICLIGFYIFLFVNSDNYGAYVFLCLSVFSFHMHCMFNGANYEFIYKSKSIIRERKQEVK